MNKRIRKKILKEVHFIYKCDGKWGVEPDAELLGYSIFQIVKAWFKEKNSYINFDTVKK